MSDLAKTRAKDDLELVRELGRRNTEEFIPNWLLSSYDDAERHQIDVVFPDELGPEKCSPEAGVVSHPEPAKR